MKIAFSFTILCALLPLTASAQGAGIDANVIKVKDGDSIIVKSKGRKVEIRLASIDAPEYSQDYGQYCKANLAAKIMGQKIRYIPEDKDRYGRTIAVIYLDNRNINRELVSDGCAWAYVKYLRDPQLIGLEQQARRGKKALWSQKNPTPPWLYRKGN